MALPPTLGHCSPIYQCPPYTYGQRIIANHPLSPSLGQRVVPQPMRASGLPGVHGGHARPPS